MTRTLADNTAQHTNDVVSHPQGARGPSPRVAFWSGAVLSIALVGIFLLQVFWARVMITPWYLPIGGSLAALVVVWAVARQWRWWRLGIALGCVALAGLEWYFLLALTVLPAYTGPVAEGSTLPAFHASLADRTEINESHFLRGGPTALVFFQGRWCPFCMTQLRDLDANHERFTRLGVGVAVVSIEDLGDAQQTQQQFPHLTVVSDERRELSGAVDLIRSASAPDGGDSAAPTILLIDQEGKVQWIHRPTRFIARPGAAELAAIAERELLVRRK